MCAERRVKVAAILSVVLGGPSMRGLSLGTFAAAKLCRGQQGCTCDALHEMFSFRAAFGSRWHHVWFVVAAQWALRGLLWSTPLARPGE